MAAHQSQSKKLRGRRGATSWKSERMGNPCLSRIKEVGLGMRMGTSKMISDTAISAITSVADNDRCSATASARMHSPAKTEIGMSQCHQAAMN
jgi:hypothetical protein